MIDVQVVYRYLSLKKISLKYIFTNPARSSGFSGFKSILNILVLFLCGSNNIIPTHVKRFYHNRYYNNYDKVECRYCVM